MAWNQESSDEEENVLDDYKGKNGVMFLIDFRQNMFEKDRIKNKSYFRVCLNTCKTLMLDIAKSGRDDLVGVSLVGTERGSNDGTTLLANVHALDSVSAASIKDIDQIIVDDGDSLCDKYGRICSSAGLNLVKVLNSCLKLFLECRKKIYAKTIVLMTTDDDPFGKDVRSAHLARKQAGRLSCAGVDLVVVGLGNKFESNKFYNELIALARGQLDRDWSKKDRVIKLDDIDNHLTSLVSRLSRTYRDLHLCKGLAIPVALYKLYREPKVRFQRKIVARKENVDVDTDEETSTSNNAANSSSTKDAPLSSSIVRSVAQNYGQSNDVSITKEKVPLFGGKLVNLTRRELGEANFKDIDTGITVIGYMPTRDIPEYLSVVPPRVMLPNYFSKEGMNAFFCVLEHCREAQLSIVGWYRYNQFSNISLVVCHPMSEQSDAMGNVCPHGFCLLTVPFFDNYSDPEDVKSDAEPSEKQIEAAKIIIKKLSAAYTVDSFHDYELQKTLAMVEALALDYDEVPLVTDDTILQDDTVNSRICDNAVLFNDCSHLGPYDSIGATKRSGGPTSFRASKNPKLNSIEGLIETIQEGQSDMLTVAQLKMVLDSKGILYSTSVKKAELIQYVNKHFR